MKLRVNGEDQEIVGTTLAVTELLDQLGLGCRRVAVEVSEAIVPRARHAEHRLTDGDVIEIVQFVGGG